jgi:diguanylate cyclase (GGDEF)-like protein
MNDAFQRAHFTVATEERLAHEYRHQPGPEARARFDAAARTLDGVVAFLHENGDAADREPIAHLEADHNAYREAVYRQFAAADAGDERKVEALDAEIQPLFERIEADVGEGASGERDELLEGLAALRQRVVSATPIIVGTGIALLVVLCAVLVRYQRRTEIQAAENQHQALHDALTGLPNRTLLRDRAGQAIRQSDRELVPTALLLIDLDRFKEVNDTLGHHYGDRLLVQVGQRLQGALRQVDTVARLGGDEFAVLLPKVAGGESLVAVAKKLLDALAEPFVVEDVSLDIEASMGLVLYPDHGNDADELLQRADIAMYAAKQSHAGFVLFDPSWTSTAPAASPCSASCAAASSKGSSCSTTSPRSTPTAAACWVWRRWCAGITPSTAWCRPPSSSP